MRRWLMRSKEENNERINQICGLTIERGKVPTKTVARKRKDMQEKA